jgi:outer membrane protein assembly factor BamD (BamD/ComL family)
MNKAKKPAGTPLLSERREAALEEYEKGFRLMQQKDYAKAIPRFEAVLSEYPQEMALCDRARTYLRVCRRDTSERQPLRQTRNAEQTYEVGVFLLNDGDYKEAARHLERAGEHASGDASVQIALATARLGAGDVDGCLAALRRAFELDPKQRHYVRNVADFEMLDEHPDFVALLVGD